MAVVVFKNREVKKVHSEELQRMLKDEVLKAKIFSWLFVK